MPLVHPARKFPGIRSDGLRLPFERLHGLSVRLGIGRNRLFKGFHGLVVPLLHGFARPGKGFDLLPHLLTLRSKRVSRLGHGVRRRREASERGAHLRAESFELLLLLLHELVQLLLRLRARFQIGKLASRLFHTGQKSVPLSPQLHKLLHERRPVLFRLRLVLQKRALLILKKTQRLRRLVALRHGAVALGKKPSHLAFLSSKTGKRRLKRRLLGPRLRKTLPEIVEFLLHGRHILKHLPVLRESGLKIRPTLFGVHHPGPYVYAQRRGSQRPRSQKPEGREKPAQHHRLLFRHASAFEPCCSRISFHTFCTRATQPGRSSLSSYVQKRITRHPAAFSSSVLHRSSLFRCPAASR